MCYANSFEDGIEPLKTVHRIFIKFLVTSSSKVHLSTLGIRIRRSIFLWNAYIFLKKKQTVEIKVQFSHIRGVRSGILQGSVLIRQHYSHWTFKELLVRMGLKDIRF